MSRLAGMEDRAAYSAENCSVARTLAVVGEKWTLLVLREVFYGVRRFSDLQTNLGIARNLLAARLTTLTEHGILRRTTYRDPGSRSRQEYQLTDKGRDLFPALIALMQWGDTYLADPAGPAVVIRHKDCDEPVRAMLQCVAGHHPLTARDTHPVPGPGVRRAVS
jgi:DNA-binding HxlR family transcriptional regulator